MTCGLMRYSRILYPHGIIRPYFYVTSPGHSIAMTARSKLLSDQERATLYRLFRYIGFYRFDAVFT